jgi:hypothetical protein
MRFLLTVVNSTTPSMYLSGTLRLPQVWSAECSSGVEFCARTISRCTPQFPCHHRAVSRISSPVLRVAEPRRVPVVAPLAGSGPTPDRLVVTARYEAAKSQRRTDHQSNNRSWVVEVDSMEFERVLVQQPGLSGDVRITSKLRSTIVIGAFGVPGARWLG